jgi:hypothetical protein
MPRGGSKPGERRGGRKKGTPNKATLEKALVAEHDLAEAKANGRRLGKEVLDHYMHVFAEIADSERSAALSDKPENSPEHESRFERFARYAVDCAHKLAPYQSPTFKAIVVAPAEQASDITDMTVELFERELPMIEDQSADAANANVVDLSDEHR